MSINSNIVSAKADNVLSLAKLWSEALDTRKNKSFIDRLKNIGPNIEPWGTPDIIFWKLLAKLWSEALDTRKNKSFIDRLKNIGPDIEPWGTPDIIFW